MLWAALTAPSLATDCAALFDSRQVVTLEIALDPSEWERLQADGLDADAGRPVAARLRCEDGPALSVGLLRSTEAGDPGRVSLEVVVDRFFPGQTLAGRSGLTLRAGVPASPTADGEPWGLVHVVVNGQYAGLYTGLPRRAGAGRSATGAAGWGAAKAARGAIDGGSVVINEVLANTLGGDDVEYIELYNAGTAAQDLAGWFLLDDDDTHTPCPLSGSLAPGAYLVVPGLLERFAARYPRVTALNAAEFDSTVVGQGFSLGNGQDAVRLFRDAGGTAELVDVLTYGRQGVDITFGYRPEDAGAPEYLSTPTPGASNSASALHSPICINEFLSTSMSGGIDDWVELYNRGDATVDIGGWFLSDDAGTPLRYVLPPGTTIAPGGFFTVDELTLGFSFSSTGSEVILLTDSDTVTGHDYYDFGPQFPDVSQGRFPDGSPNWHFFVSPTRDAANDCAAGPSPPGAVGGLVFSSPTTIGWNAAPGAVAYDILRGDLPALRDALGDYSAAVADCAGNDRPPTTALAASVPPVTGQADFYLVRGVHLACGFGSYDTASASQAAGRDAGIAASTPACP